MLANIRVLMVSALQESTAGEACEPITEFLRKPFSAQVFLDRARGVSIA